MNDVHVTNILILIVLLFIAGVCSILFKRLRLPYTIGLVMVGLGIGALGQHVEGMRFLASVHLTPNIVLYILLPSLVFEAALNMDTRLLGKNLFASLFLAAPGLVLATLFTGALIGLLTPLPFGPAMLFGALISTTDPVAVISVFKELDTPPRLTMLVDAESLFNDATAIVLFTIILGLLGGGVLGAGTVFAAGVSFVVVFFGGALLGALLGYIMVRIFGLAQNDPLVGIAFSIVIAYSAFIIAQFYLNLSGVTAVVGAGLMVSYYGANRLSSEIKTHVTNFWKFACFAANGYIFLLLGLSQDYLTRGSDRLGRVGMIVAAAIAVVTLARALLVYGLCPVINKLSKSPPITKAYQAIMFWGGLRGALPIALALSLKPEHVGGELNRLMIIDCALGVVLFTLLIQGTTIRCLINRLNP